MIEVDAVIMAGGSAEAVSPGLRFKGLVEVAGVPMVERVVDALRACGCIRRIVVTVPVADDLGAWTSKADRVVVTDGSFADNAVAGLDACGEGTHVLICTGDLPALRPDAVEDFVRRSLEAGADFSYPVIPRDDMEREFPGSQRTYFTLDGMKVTGGNMMVLSPERARRMRDTAQRIFETRKNPFKMAGLAGPGFLLRFASGKMTVPLLEAKLTAVLEGRCVALVTHHASIGADVDKPVDVAVAEAALAGDVTPV